MQDYYGGPVRLSSNYKPGSKFAVGSTQVIYIAIDTRGVNATCTFKVNIDAQGVYYEICINNNNNNNTCI